jgi:hypothetical protein
VLRKEKGGLGTLAQKHRRLFNFIAIPFSPAPCCYTFDMRKTDVEGEAEANVCALIRFDVVK